MPKNAQFHREARLFNRTHGVVFGKFYPPHRGHKFLIDTATATCDLVTVAVLASPVENISVYDRMEWLREIHPTVRVVGDVIDLPVSYQDPDIWDAWDDAIINLVQGQPTHLFTSEEYGNEQARRFDCKHVQVDGARHTFPVSGTTVRKNPRRYWWMLEPPVRAALTKRIVLAGAESVGKTTLSRNLSIKYNTMAVPEYGRELAQVKMALGDELLEDWEEQDFKQIVDKQIAEEDRLAQYAGPLMICDTDPLVTMMWWERYFDRPVPDWLYDAVEERVAKYDTYLLLNSDVPLVHDGQREFGPTLEKRDHMTERYRETLKGFGCNWVEIGGQNWEERYDDAVNAIDIQLARGWHFNDPLDHHMDKWRPYA